MPGPQPGEGSSPVAEMWLTIVCEREDETEAAAAPATITANIKTRTASFIIGYSPE
jgi:hypothetical protein